MCIRDRRRGVRRNLPATMSATPRRHAIDAYTGAALPIDQLLLRCSLTLQCPRRLENSLVYATQTTYEAEVVNLYTSLFRHIRQLEIKQKYKTNAWQENNTIPVAT